MHSHSSTQVFTWDKPLVEIPIIHHYFDLPSCSHVTKNYYALITLFFHWLQFTTSNFYPLIGSNRVKLASLPPSNIDTCIRWTCTFLLPPQVDLTLSGNKHQYSLALLLPSPNSWFSLQVHTSLLLLISTRPINHPNCFYVVLSPTIIA